MAEEIDQVDTSHKEILKCKQIQALATQVDNVNCCDIAELNVLDKVDKSNTSKDCVAEDTYYLDKMRRTASTFANLQWLMNQRTKSIIFSMY